MVENVKFTKEWYRREIVDRKKSIPQIANERGVSAVAIRKEIRALYQRAAWANKLIGQAAANEAANRNLVNKPTDAVQVKKTKKSQKKPQEKPKKNMPAGLKLAIKHGVGVVDSNYAINYYDDCKIIEHLIIPRFCLNEMRRIAEHTPNVKERQAIERKIRYFEKKAEILYVEKLPELVTTRDDTEFKRRNFNFARYVQYVWQLHGFKVPYLTCAYEANVLIRECVALDKAEG